ncbi:hypothetical protein [Halobacterium jilantaiense]|uniref:Uncharacterized protein n=1 Tax=Halobacterium jilantaiense TaxID=355548 RepID=A0A1I0Q6I4_9EURY|nr:hypothetical protein [Halobacterium jilantaiense]SEW22460.1 hypothetical protein SAMN04487945_2316 [Halobacterium jilantaiense]
MVDRDADSDGLSRRSVLKTAAAAAGGLSVGPAMAGARSASKATKVTERGSISRDGPTRTRTLTLRADGDAQYEFAVSGTLSPKQAPRGAVDSGTASATLADDTHAYEFSGEVVEITTTGRVDVTINGERFDAEAHPEKSLSVVARGRTDVDISASGGIEAVDADLDQPNPRRVTGTIRGRTDFKYSGELTYLEPADDVKVFKQGSPVDAGDVLPSNLPGKLHITGGNADATVHTSDAARIEQGTGARAADGTVTGSPTARDVVARYDGNVEQIEHENGAAVEVWETSKRLLCSAPADTSVSFAVEASEGVALDREDTQRAEFTVDAGQTKAVKYRGRPAAVSIDALDIRFDPEVYKDAVESAKRQLAAQFERTSAFQQIQARVDGRIRHDAQALRTTSTTGDVARDMAFFQLTDLPEADFGSAHLSRVRRSNEVQQANYELQWLADDGNPRKLSVHQLSDPARGSSFDVQTFERGTKHRSATDAGPSVDVFDGSAGGTYTTQWFSVPDWVPDVPSPQDLLDAFGDTLSDFASTVGDITKETASDIISNAIENAQNTTIDDIAIKTSTLIVDSQEVLIELVAEAQDKLPKRTLSKFLLGIKPGFAGSLVSLGQSGAFQEIADNNLGCGGCLAMISILLSVGLEATAYGTCTALGIAFPIAGGVACGAVVGALLEYANTIAGPDVVDVCSGYGTPTELDAC